MALLVPVAGLVGVAVVGLHPAGRASRLNQAARRRRFVAPVKMTDRQSCLEFRRQDPERAGAWVMACFGSLHDVVIDPGDLPAAIDELNAFVLGALGYVGEAGR